MSPGVPVIVSSLEIWSLSDSEISLLCLLSSVSYTTQLRCIGTAYKAQELPREALWSVRGVAWYRGHQFGRAVLHISPLPWTSCVPLGELLTFSGLQFNFFFMGKQLNL